jgi:inorganic pyrophosphatase
MIDGNEADDKIMAVMEGDGIFGHWKDISDAPSSLTDRLKHYFLTYKDAPGADHRNCEITHVYGKEEAHEIIKRSYDDYIETYADLDKLLRMKNDRNKG